MILHKKAWVLQELTPETDLHYSNFEYRIRKSMVTENVLSMREKVYNEFRLKLRLVKMLIQLEEYSECMVKDVNFIMPMIKEMKTRKDYESMSITFAILLHVLNSDTSWHQLDDLWKQEEITCLLSDVLSILPEGLLYTVFEVFLRQNKMMNVSVRLLEKMNIVYIYQHFIKTDTYINLLFNLLWCRKQINEGHADIDIIIGCLNNYYMEKCQGSIVEFTAQILNIIYCLPENSFLKVILQGILRKNLKTVTSMAISTPGYDRSGQIVNLNSTAEKSKKGLIYTQCASILSGNKMKNVDIKQYARKLNIKGPEDENEVETVSGQVKLLVLCILLLLVTALGNKSAKLKKYLALKYEYVMASLYLLWCSGDIEVHPGPPWRTKQLTHYSEQKRKWLQNINSILHKLYKEILTPSKSKKQWPADKQFYDTKIAPNDAKGNKITDDEILTCSLECLKNNNVVLPQIYQHEILAWTNGNIELLHKLQVFRIEMEKVKTASINLFLSNLENVAKNLQNIKVSLENPTLDKKQTEGLLNNDLRQKKQAEIVAEITRDIANTLCRLVKGTDPMEKGDGTWNTPPVDWPEDVPFFNTKNRGKNKGKPKCPDAVLVCTFLKLQHLKIPENLKQIVEAYQTMYNCTDIHMKKKNKDELCRLYSIQSNLETLDCSLHNLYKEGLFSREVHAILNQWWKTQLVDEHAEHVLKNAIVRSDERPHITIDITKFFEQDTDLRYISYTIPIKDAYLHIKCKTGHEQTITGPLVPANNSENIEDSVLPSDLINFVLEHGFVDQTKCPNDNSVTDNGPMPFDLQRQGTPLPITNQHLTPHNDLDILTTHKSLSSDLNSSRRTTKYDTTTLKDCDSVHSLNSRNSENLGGNMGTSKVKRKQLEDKEERVKKLLKIKVNQSNGFSLELDPDSTSSLGEICSDNVLDSWSLYLHENIDEVKNNDNQNDQIEDDEELESFSDLDNFISGKPSQMEKDLL